MDNEYNDDIPVWVGADAPTVTIEGTNETAVQATGPFDSMLYAGGRKEKAAADWDFQPVRKPAFVMHTEEAAGATIARVNNADGEPSAYHIFNPTYAGEKRPAGAYLGTFSAAYYPMPYGKGFRPILDIAKEQGWPAQVVAWNEGKQAACYCDVTSSVDWDDIQVSQNWGRQGFAKVGDYRVGIVIHNSLDGSSAYKVQAMAQRLACTNGMVMGDKATLISLRHTNGVLGNFDFKGLADKIGQVIQSAATEILLAESMRGVEVTTETFEKLMTICERKGLITKPTVKRNDEGGIVSLGRGHMWRLMGQGWTQPHSDWVSVSEEDTGTLYHVYNILTGAITHKPVWSDGTAVLKGGTLNFNSFNDKLATVHKVLGDMATKELGQGQALSDQLESVPMFSQVIR